MQCHFFPAQIKCNGGTKLTIGFAPSKKQLKQKKHKNQKNKKPKTQWSNKKIQYVNNIQHNPPRQRRPKNHRQTTKITGNLFFARWFLYLLKFLLLFLILILILSLWHGFWSWRWNYVQYSKYVISQREFSNCFFKFQTQFQHTHFGHSFNTHIPGAVSFQVQFPHKHFRYSFNTHISTKVQQLKTPYPTNSW